MCKERDEVTTKIDRLISVMERLTAAVEALAPTRVYGGAAGASMPSAPPRSPLLWGGTEDSGVS